jgi:hypothetical protein
MHHFKTFTTVKSVCNWHYSPRELVKLFLRATKRKEILKAFNKEQARKRSLKLENRTGKVWHLTTISDIKIDQIYNLLAELEADHLQGVVDADEEQE